MALRRSAGPQLLSRGFYRDGDLDFAVRGLLGRAVHGAAEVGEVLATIAHIPDHSHWADEWTTTASRVENEAIELRDGGHLVSARSGYLRAATYWACVVDGLTTSTDNDRLLEAFRSHRRCWEAFIDTSDGTHVRLDVPYENTTLPGYLLRPDNTGTARPTLVITNGSDGAVSDLWTSAAAGALARGWNAYLYDGPGQQSMLFEHTTYFRPDWEAVLTPVIDTIIDRSDVDPERLTGYGISQAGYWLPRALAYEHRLRAAVIDPGVVNVAASWLRPLSKGMQQHLENGDRDKFNRDMNLAAKIPSLRRTLTFRGRPYQHTDWFDLYQAVMAHRLDPATAASITTPMLLTSPEHEQFWPGQSEQLAAMTTRVSQVLSFTAAEGANYHCQPMGRLLTENRMFDWLEDLLHQTMP